MKKLVMGSLIIIAVFGVRIYYVNANAPQQSVEIYQEDEWVAYDGAYQMNSIENTYGYFVKVNRGEVVLLQDYLEKYNLSGDSYFSLMQGYYNMDKDMLLAQNVLDVEMEFKNEYSENGSITLNELLVFGEGDNIAYMINESILMEMNPILTTGTGLGFSLKPNGESVKLNIPFMLPIYTNGTIGEETGNYPKMIRLTRAPIKKCIQIE